LRLHVPRRELYEFSVVLQRVRAKGVLQSALYRVGVTQEIGMFEILCCIGCVQCQVSREIANRQAHMAAGGGGAAAAPQVIVVHAPAAMQATK
jgi:hypothetical protein